MNKCILYGNVGKDPEVKTFDGGKKVAKFSLATSSYSKDKEGNKVTQTEWHNITVWDKLAELAQSWIKKGSAVIVEGEIRYRQYTDKEGVVKYFTEILGNSVHLTGKKEEEKKPEVKDDLPSHVREQQDFSSKDDEMPF